MGRPTGQETDAIEKSWCLIVPKRRGKPRHTGSLSPRGSTKDVRRQGGGETETRSFIIVSAGRNGAGRVSRLTIA